MPAFTLYFEAPAGTDAEAKSIELQQGVSSLPGVSSAEATAGTSRHVGPTEIIAWLTVASTLIRTSSDAIKAVADLLDGAKKLGTKLGLGRVCVGVGSKKVPPDQLTEAQLRELSSE